MVLLALLLSFLISRPTWMGPLHQDTSHKIPTKYQLVNQGSFICQKTFKITSNQLATLLSVFRLKAKVSYYILHITHKTSQTTFNIRLETWRSGENASAMKDHIWHLETSCPLGAVHIWRQPKLKGSRPSLTPCQPKSEIGLRPSLLVRKNQKPAYPPYPLGQKSDFDVTFFLKNTL